MSKRAWLATTGLLAACAHEAPVPPAAPRPVEPAQTRAAPPPPASEYVLADPAKASALTMLPLGDGDSGVVIEGQRIALHAGGPRTARDVGDLPIQSGWRVPARLGGGFLFRAKAGLYASETFEGLLRPVVALPADVASVSFGPRGALVRVDSGERWMIDLASGRRQPMTPPGLLDVAALDDGRAAALVTGGALLVSTDTGAHWSDASAQLGAPARRVFVVAATPAEDAGLWIETTSGQGARVMPGGRVAGYDGLPAPAPAPTLRPRPDGWREEEAPLRRAMRLGAPTGDGAALVVATGDLARVDLATGAVTVVAGGKLPPDATCAGTRTADDVVFTCGRPSGTAFVVSHALAGAPVVEQTFPESGRFVVSDDGGVAFLGGCERPGPRDRRVACVRAPGGTWHEVDAWAGSSGGDAGMGPGPSVVRWIPRADGGAVAVVSAVGGVANAWGLLDGRTGEIHAWPVEAVTPMLQSALTVREEGGKGGAWDAARLTDRAWTLTPRGTLRGWASFSGGTGAIEVGVDGSVQTSAFTFDRVAAAGPLALTRLRDGRVWQTLDRGATWSEVAAPPASKRGGWLDVHACSLVGCDLAQWYRVGWATSSPAALPPPPSAPPAPRVERAPAPTLTCTAAGDAKRSILRRGGRSPDDLGLGAARVAVSAAGGKIDFLRVAFSRRIAGAAREVDTSDDTAPRALVHGPATQPGDERLVVLAADRDALSLVRQVSFVPAFDPLGALRRTGVALRDVVAAARASGASVPDALRDDPVPSAVVPVTPADSAAPDDLLVQIANGGVALARASGAAPRARVAVEAGRTDEWRLVSAVALADDAVAWLEEDSSGRARVMRLGSSGTPSLVHELDAPPSPELYPANVDALAVGPRGELAVLRTPSGSEPPSAFDPALLVLPGAGATPLAPWSTLLPADDPACRSDAGGFRVTVQASAPWLRLAGGAETRGAEDVPMLARVRWSAARACLEGVELRAADASATPPGGPSPLGAAWDLPVETWVVARFAGGAAAGRVAVIQGAEGRQPLECKLGP